jgi:hypothetical protein
MLSQKYKGNLSTTDLQSAVLCQAHPKNENCLQHIAKLWFGVQYTTPNKLVIPN